MTTLKAFLIELLIVAISISAALLFLMLGLTLAHYPAAQVLGDWLHGAIGTRTSDILIALEKRHSTVDPDGAGCGDCTVSVGCF